MGKCVPGMPCYGANVIVYTTYPAGCSTTTPGPFTLPVDSDNLVYVGPALTYTEIENGDTISVALQKIDAKLSPSELIGLIITAIEGDDDLRAALCTALNC